MNQFKPFPIGTIRGPYRNDKTFRTGNGSVQFLVQGAGGWCPFVRPEKYKGQSEAECREAAEAYSKHLLSKP